MSSALTARTTRGSGSSRREEDENGEGGGDSGIYHACDSSGASASDAEAAAEQAEVDKALYETLQQQCVEVECLLRVQLIDAAALKAAHERIRAALDFDTSLVRYCKFELLLPTDAARASTSLSFNSQPAQSIVKPDGLSLVWTGCIGECARHAQGVHLSTAHTRCVEVGCV